jgi:hypothetical protein
MSANFLAKLYVSSNFWHSIYPIFSKIFSSIQVVFTWYLLALSADLATPLYHGVRQKGKNSSGRDHREGARSI